MKIRMASGCFCLILMLGVLGCESKKTPEEIFKAFVEASGSGTLQDLEALVTSEGLDTLKREFRSRHSSVEKGFLRFQEDTKRVNPRYLRTEPVRRHEVVRIVFQSEQGEQSMLVVKDSEGSWKIAMRSLPVLPRNEDLPRFQPDESKDSGQ